VKPIVKKVAKGKFFIFQFINKESGQPVRGELHFSESSKATQYQAYKANELIDVPAPRNASGAIFITTVAPGYKVLETTINYKDPLPSSSGTGPDGELIVPLNLERAKKGDYIEFNNVSFYKNSVIMQPEFKDEMDGLVDLMKENVNYKVRIHGHCNGNEARNIITLGSSVKYFESDPGNEKKNGSAKELTELRAEAARRYLISQGIDVERILTKGEGGKEMVYPQTSVYANYNDRIEVEVVRH
jgi:outer membrane protein OmpA-like peptidoglycan-associated protein